MFRVVRPKTPRGDGNTSHALPLARIIHRVVRPKTPRGDGNLHPESPYARNASNVSSDPKPREGTETRGTVPPGPAPSGSSDPKPREGTETHIGDGDAARGHAESSDPKPREGTETGQRSTPALVDFRVVRPKTPRGDGNMGYLLPARGDAVRGRQTQNPERGRKHGISAARPGRCCPRSSDPKPREGTETCAPSP
ncbi:hypothetical protein AN68_04008 [Mycobacterium tuberculosis M1274]|nr:hypothetical protein AN68_04008 [Mycobacterium tuberculosis M1274]